MYVLFMYDINKLNCIKKKTYLLAVVEAKIMYHSKDKKQTNKFFLNDREYPF